jgi:hypothetical protein
MAFAFNRSHMNRTVKANLLKAIVKARKQGIEHVLNRKGHAFLAVRNTTQGLIIVDQTGRNIKEHLLAWSGYGQTDSFRGLISSACLGGAL